MSDAQRVHKSYKEPRAGRKAEKKELKKKKKLGLSTEKHNPKAFAFSNGVAASAKLRKSLDTIQKRLHVKIENRVYGEPPPKLVAVVGPPQSGKSTLIKSLVKHYTKNRLSEITGPITVKTGKTRQIFFECPNDLNAMIDISKLADLVVLVIDASYGFEMESFEFLNILQTHGFTRVLGVMTHLDKIKKSRQVKQLKKRMKERFWTEVCDGAKLFYISGTRGQLYTPRETLNLSRYITVIKPRPLTWRASHPGILVDRFEDITDPELIRQDKNCNRHVCMYGFVRGTFLRKGMPVHIPGCGDFQMKDITSLDDPLPLDEKEKGKIRRDKHKGIYAPMSNMGDLFYDKDSVYIEMEEDESDPTQDSEKTMKRLQQERLVRSIMKKADSALDEKLQSNNVKLFSNASKSIGIKKEDTMAIKQEESESDNEEDEENFEDEDDEEDNNDSEEDEETDEEINMYDEEEEDPNRKRRRADFKDEREEKTNEDIKYDEDEEDNIEDAEYFDPENNPFKIGKSGAFEEDEKEEIDLEELDEQVGSDISRWKEKMHETASDAFYSTEISLQNLVYGDPSEAKKQKQDKTNIFKDDIKEEEDENENLFDFVKKIASKKKTHIEKVIDEEDINVEDCTVTQMEPSDLTTDWDDPEVRESIRNKFVTGDWSSRRDAAEHGVAKDDQENGMNDNEASDNEEVDEDNIEVDYGEYNENDPESISKKREEKKKSFDQTFDKLKDNNASDDEDKNPDDPLTVEKWRRKQLEDDPQTILNKTEFEGLNKQLREQIEGFSPGTYVRIEFVDFPSEFIENVDFHNPIIVGGMHQEECRMGYIKIRLKRHRWFPKTLKNKDPLVFSIGWRRFQSIPTYCVQDVNGRHRMIKYTPEYMHCIAAIYGPYMPQNTGVIAFQTLSNKVDTFRVAATGYVMEIDQNFQIVKKLKLIGYPKKVYKNTAFITGMFSSSLEIAKYEGAALRTVSGIRGQVKKASKQGQEGEFRATFEDKILMSDIVFLRVWYQLELDKFYNPVLNHLTKKWYAMRTVYQLRKLRGESIPVNKNSQYRPVEERSTIGHDQTFIPKPNLLKKLPFSAQNKKVVESTGLTDDLKKHLSANAPLHDLTTALMSDKEILRANMLRKMQAIDADRRKKQQRLEAKFQLKMKTKEVREERLRNRKKSATQKRKYIEQEMRRIKKAKYYSGDNEQK